MGGLFGGGKKKSSGASAPRETIAAPPPAVDPDVVAADQRRRQAMAQTDTLMTEGVPSLEGSGAAAEASRRQLLGG